MPGRLADVATERIACTSCPANRRGEGGVCGNGQRIDEFSSPTAYIPNQPEHRRKTTFTDDFGEFLREYELEYDERYEWD